MNPNKIKSCFELFGFDFMIDVDFRTWLIEVNTNPYLGMQNKHMKSCFSIIISGSLDVVRYAL
jgi:tubulin--tyrosine ligase